MEEPKMSEGVNFDVSSTQQPLNNEPAMDDSFVTKSITIKQTESIEIGGVREGTYPSITNESIVYLETEDELSSRYSMNAFNVSGLNTTVVEVESKSKGDGSDSGVESTPAFHRTISCGYSSGGFDDLNKSCDSSLLSYSEDTELMTQSLTLFARDGTSEGGSESSALESESKTKNQNPVFIKKKSTTKLNKSFPSNQRIGSSSSSGTLVSDSQHSTSRRQNITPIKYPVSSSPKPTAHTTKKEKTGNSIHGTDKLPGSISKVRSISNLEPRSHNLSLRDSPNAATGKKTNTSVKPKIAAKPILSTPRQSPRTDDGRWPSSANRSTTPHHKPQVSSVLEKKKSIELSTSKVNHVDSKATFDRYGTLPRRSRRRSPETSKESLRSYSVNRDQSINRVRRNVRDVNKTLPLFPRKKPRTRIYHEISVQTALTSLDVEKALEGTCFKEPRLDVEYQDQEVQVDRWHEAVERLDSELKSLKEDNGNLEGEVKSHKESIQSLEKQLSEERADKESAKDELSKTDARLLVMLGKGGDDESADNLQELEAHLQSSGQIVIKQQKEIFHLQTLNKTLHRDLEKSLVVNKNLEQQQRESEMESTEMQEFLQAEKSLLSEALKDTEIELARQKEFVAQKTTELERRQEECNHLVRISEQRRQENLTLQGRLNGLDQRSKDLLLQQGAAVSGASVALSGLSSRLDGLVEQLVTSYDISEKDLEVVGAWVVTDTNTSDVIFHNEAYSKSNSSSAVESPEKTSNFHQPTPSPKRRASFLTAVVRAIRNATNQSPFSAKKSETEEIEEKMGKTNEEAKHSDEITDPSNIKEDKDEDKLQLVNSESLHNLSQAILNRQQFECGGEDIDSMTCGNDCEILPEIEEYSHGYTFVDQIIEVDNLVTRLLKVLRIIQLENDTNVDELQDERVQLEAEVRREQDARRNTQEAMRSLELLTARLRGEVQEAKLQLQRRVDELEETKAELKTHRDQVRALTTDNWKLSAAQRQLQNCDDEAKEVLQKWQETGDLPSPDSIAWMVTAHNEIPALREQLKEKEIQLKEMGHKFSANNELLTQNLHQAANEIRRQYEAIDNALEILQSIQGVVVQCPPLAQLQRELEEANFQCASSQPILAADLNANDAPMSANEIHNGGLDVINNPANPINGTAY